MDQRETMAELILQHRKILFAYTLAIVRDHHLAEDVFQEVSMVLIRKYQESGAIGNFWPLAREVARRQSLAAFRKQKRGVVLLSEESLDRIDRGFDDVVAETENREQALVRCLEHLPFGWRDLVSLKYWDNLPILDIARRLGKSTNTVSVTLNRIRGKLADCIQAQIRAESQG